MAREGPQRGADAEAWACRYLESQGLVLEARNYRCYRGELDLVMRDGLTLVFVEVRYRRNDRFGSAAESIDPRKQARLIYAARHYLQRRRHQPDCRFDVVALGGAGRVEWLQNVIQL